jgi:transposase InsO family protein
MWLQWAGTPSQIAHDQGGEFVTDEWKLFLQENGIVPILSSAPWQRGRIERHGGVIKEMLNRMDQENPINDLSHFDEALFQCFHAKNTMSVHEG